MNDELAMPNETTLPLEYRTCQSRCLCYGRDPRDSAPLRSNDRPPICDTDRSHSIWVALLLIDNEEDVSAQSLTDYMFVSMNWLAVKLSGYPFIHVQLVFWDAVQREFYTYSVDVERGVHVFQKKLFKRGWKFLRLSVTEAQELLVQNFLVEQLGKPMNHAGRASFYFLGISGGAQSWFCSELVAAALEHGGLVDFADWPGINRPCNVAMHHVYLYLTERRRPYPVEELVGNPVRYRMVHDKRRAMKRAPPIILGQGILPQALADFSDLDRPAAAATSSSGFAPQHRSVEQEQMYYERRPPVTTPQRSSLDLFAVTPPKKRQQ